MLLSPLTLALLLGLLWFTLGRKVSRILRLALALLLFSCVLCTTPLVANALVWWLERQVPSPAASCQSSSMTTVVVLSGGFDRTPATPGDIAALNLDSLHRLMAGLSLVASAPEAEMILSGKGSHDIAESTVMADMAIRLGLPQKQIRTETASLNTLDNARQTWRLRTAWPGPIHLVTSGIHLPRAARAFSRAGFQVCPHASDSHYVPPQGLWSLLPQASAVTKTESVWHEWAGLAQLAWLAHVDP